VKSNNNKEIHSEVYRFSDYLLDAGRRELRLFDTEIQLQPRVFDLLIYLVRHRDRAVSKEELQDAVWPGMVVTETVLTRAVMKARKAVGDDAGTQSVIKTLHGHGYRFVAELQAGSALDTSGQGSSPEQATAVTRDKEDPDKARGPWLAVALIVILIAAVLSWLQFGSGQTQEGDVRVAVMPLDNQTGDPDLAWTSLGLMSFVSNMLEADTGIAVVSDGSVISLADSFGWEGSPGGGNSSDVFDRLRRVFGATHILTMDLSQDGTFLRMNYSLLDAGGDEYRGTMVGEEPTGLAKGVVQGVYGLILKKSRLASDAELVSVDPFNNEAYARGMGLSLEGRCSEAVQYFRIIAEQEPGLFSPRYELASCLRVLGQVEEAEPLLLQLVAEQEAFGDSRALASSLLVLGILYNRTGRLDDAEATHQQALNVSRAIDDPELSARILQNLAIIAEDRNEWDESWKLLDLARLEYQRAGREIIPGQLYSAQANLKMDRGELAEAEVYLEQALAAFREAGDRRNEAMMLNNTGYLRRQQGRLEEAEQFHRQSLAIREAIGDRMGVGRIYGMLAVVLTERGDLLQAKQAAEQAVSIARETRDRLFEGTSLAQLADAEKALGDPDSARDHYMMGRDVFAAIGDQMRVLQSEVLLAQLELDQGNLGAVEETATIALQKSRSLDLIQPEVEAIELLGDLRLAQGDLAAASEEYAAALDRVRQSSWTGKENTLLVKQANVLMDLGQLDAAAPLVGALSGQERTLSSLMAQARFAFQDGDAALATQLMETARERAGDDWDEESEAILRSYKTKPR
jgi:DNA-binding winged helix-turn-helix (wHTH) protein/tetratricopeptide (TPR) repeat protein